MSDPVSPSCRHGGLWVKLCGFTREPDVRVAVRAGADAIGLVLAPDSPRRVSVEQACRLAEVAREQSVADRGRPVQVVGVFTQSDGEWVAQAAEAIRLDAIQLHGGQPEALRRRLEEAGWACIRTLWPSWGDPPPAWEGRAPWAFLLDSRSQGRAGGTGIPQAVKVARAWREALGTVAPVILAGGLGPHNVAFYLDAVRPWGVDASSGLERPGTPGIKDPETVRLFVQAVRHWEVEREGAT